MPVIKADSYSVTIGNQAFKALSRFLAKKTYASCFILCDENTLQHCLPVLITHCPELGEAQIIEIESGEASKSIAFCEQIWQTLLENKADKNTVLINLGGGVVSDLGGFIASVYKRGIDFLHLPTSLLAMADASVGAKTGIDFLGIKNSIGSFASPKAVFIYPGFLNTLPARQYQNGLAEIFKIALVADAAFWPGLVANKQAVERLLVKSISLKNAIVLADPFDKGRRKSLNFGHTLGHAIESLFLGSEQEWLHGEAIVAGMILESHIAFQKKLISQKILNEISTALVIAFEPRRLQEKYLPKMMELMANDKKTSGGTLQMALIDKIGSCRVDVKVTAPQVQKALAYYSQLTA